MDMHPCLEYTSVRLSVAGAGHESWFSSKTHHYESESEATDLFLASTQITSNPRRPPSTRPPFAKLGASAEAQRSKSQTPPVEDGLRRRCESGNSDRPLCLFAPPTRFP